MSSTESYDKDFYDLMDDINNSSEEIYCTTGDENWELLEFLCEHCRYHTLYPEVIKYVPDIHTYFGDRDELQEILQEVLFENDDLYDKVLKLYISMYY